MAAFRRRWFDLENPGIRIAPSPIAGVGVFATRPFEQYEMISPYDGYIVAAVEIEQKKKQLLKEGSAAALKQLDEDFSHLMTVQETRGREPLYYIDGTRHAESGIRIRNPETELRGRGMAAYFNDAHNTAFENNAAFFKMYDNNVPTDFENLANRYIVFARAKRDIATGEEILVSYEKDYWEEHEAIRKKRSDARLSPEKAPPSALPSPSSTEEEQEEEEEPLAYDRPESPPLSYEREETPPPPSPTKKKSSPPSPPPPSQQSKRRGTEIEPFEIERQFALLRLI